MASPDWFADPRGSDGLGDVPMLEFLLPPAEDPAEPDPVATTPRLYQEQGEAEPPFPHRPSRRRTVVGKGPHAPHNPLEHLLGVASESRERRGLGDSNKKKMNDESPSLAAEREPATPSELKWSGDMQSSWARRFLPLLRHLSSPSSDQKFPPRRHRLSER